jgi:hypothetical protein
MSDSSGSILPAIARLLTRDHGRPADTGCSRRGVVLARFHAKTNGVATRGVFPRIPGLAARIRFVVKCSHNPEEESCPITKSRLRLPRRLTIC